jgi:hypothetical protein
VDALSLTGRRPVRFISICTVHLMGTTTRRGSALEWTVGTPVMWVERPLLLKAPINKPAEKKSSYDPQLPHIPKGPLLGTKLSHYPILSTKLGLLST